MPMLSSDGKGGHRLPAALRAARSRPRRAAGVMMSEGWGRVSIVSPHLDDAALSMGATIARASREGAVLSVVTVFAGDPAASGPAGNWDRACGFATEGSAARGRREEDRAACLALGARPVWLRFPDVQYAGDRDGDQVWLELGPHLDVDLVLLPGYPLTHVDHVWLTQLALERLPGRARIGFYVERPYAPGRGAPGRAAAGALALLGRGLTWARFRPGWGELRSKGRACRAYRSQFRFLKPHLRRRLALPELWWETEYLGWPEGAS